MAEATLAAETEVTPSEEVAVVTPESPTESTPAPENVEEPSVVDAFLESIGSASAENAGDHGTNATPNEVVPPAPPAPTPEQIRADERARVDEENRLKGLEWVVMTDAPSKLAALKSELSEDGWNLLVNEVNRMKGAFEPLKSKAVDVDKNLLPEVKNAAYGEAAAFTFGQLAETVKNELGENAFKALESNKDNFRSWLDVGKHIVTEARKGMVPAADYVSKASTKEHLDKLEAALNARGAQGIVTRSLKDITGNGGSDLPPMRGGTNNKPDAVLANPNASREERDAAFEAKHGFRPGV